MRDNVKELVKLVSENIDVSEPVVEIGSLQVEGQVEYADLRPFFSGKAYIGCDKRPGIGVDRIEDVEHLTFDDDSVGMLLMVDTLEHVENCHTALQQIHRVLQAKGVLLMISVMDFPVHEYPSDYWRFTPQSFKLLLRGFSPNWVFFQGNPLFPHTIIGIGFKKGEPGYLPTGIERLIERMRCHASPLAETGYDESLLREQYPTHQLHEAYKLLAEGNSKFCEQTNRLNEAYKLLAESNAKLCEQTGQLNEIYKSLSWKLIQRYLKFKEQLFPPDTRRRNLYDRTLRCLKGS